MKKGTCLKFETPLGDAISRIRFAPGSNSLLISSWDSNLRLYDVEESVLMLEVAGDASLLDCCFENESVYVASGVVMVPLRGFAARSLDGLVTLEIVQSSALLDKAYAFRCCPKSKDGKKYLTAINDIAFHPGLFGTYKKTQILSTVAKISQQHGRLIV